ncbi:beta-1 3-galactosyltransferase 16 [Tripterygium wilfordii]|uniref:Hexosyltransferase n=1 Tax=Tripterygium wilfordii TaxID=458696 RepID=A0A7J7BVS3_TRIWF|nr:beta-1,3-galactosyltransferase pvg3-like [Tripterygium wilfordii]KAF5725928.1 beta-1 3-galactosyltransferase 16 [Tripterygium wilfordii]
MKTIRLDRKRFIVSSFFLFCLSLLASLNDFRILDSLLNFRRCAFPSSPFQYFYNSSSTNFLAEQNSSSGDIRILIGILTIADQYDRRQFLRLIYGTQSIPTGAQVDVKFVFCNLTKEEQKVIVALEIMRYDDIVILNCKENMDNGKTYTYFSSLPELFNAAGRPNPPYDYVMKGDDDTYIRLPKLVESLRPLPRQDLYYGFVVPCSTMDPFKGKYMAGMGYLVSWDIVEWIRVSDIPKNHLKGPEDRVFAEWLQDGDRAKNRFNAKWSMYDFPEPPTRCTHEFWPDTVAVHKLKNLEKWVRTLKYFNVTDNLKPSKLYHIQ